MKETNNLFIIFSTFMVFLLLFCDGNKKKKENYIYHKLQPHTEELQQLWKDHYFYDYKNFDFSKITDSNINSIVPDCQYKNDSGSFKPNLIFSPVSKYKKIRKINKNIALQFPVEPDNFDN